MFRMFRCSASFNCKWYINIYKHIYLFYIIWFICLYPSIYFTIITVYPDGFGGMLPVSVLPEGDGCSHEWTVTGPSGLSRGDFHNVCIRCILHETNKGCLLAAHGWQVHPRQFCWEDMQAKEAGQVNANTLHIQLLCPWAPVRDWPVKTIQDPGSTSISTGLCPGSGRLFGRWPVAGHNCISIFYSKSFNHGCVPSWPFTGTWHGGSVIVGSALKKLGGDWKTAKALHHMPPCIAIFQLDSGKHLCHPGHIVDMLMMLMHPYCIHAVCWWIEQPRSWPLASHLMPGNSIV